LESSYFYDHNEDGSIQLTKILIKYVVRYTVGLEDWVQLASNIGLWLLVFQSSV
jgi:hypothetical protein